jgi:hypothetical protein
MNLRPRTLANALWLGLVLLIAGRLLDLQWHVGHDEFETASDQLRAHWLAWAGAILLLILAAVATRQQHPSRAMTVLLVSAAGYLAVAAWHFYEHSQHRDTDLPHVLLAVTQLAMLVAAPLAALALRPRPARARHG